MSALSSDQEILPVESRHWWPEEVWWHNRTDSWRDWCMGGKKKKRQKPGVTVTFRSQPKTIQRGELYFKRQKQKEREGTDGWFCFWFVQRPADMSGPQFCKWQGREIMSVPRNIMFFFERKESEALHKEEQHIYCRTPQSICKSSSSLLGICLFECCVRCFTFSAWNGEAVVVIAVYPQGRQNKLDSLSRNNCGSKLFFFFFFA